LQGGHFINLALIVILHSFLQRCQFQFAVSSPEPASSASAK
jgi:hypothetical protein